MPAFLRKLFERYAKRMLTHPVRPSILEEGIMTIPQNKRVKRWAEDVYQDLKAAGVTDDMIKTEKDIKTLHSQVAELNNQNIAKGFERILDESKPKKLADVLDLTGKKIPPGSQIMGGKEVKIDIVADTIATIKSKKPIDAMKEANSVIGRKGKYKKLTPEESKKILKDTEDHIFQRDVPPEDFAGGGRASSGLNYLLGEDDQNVRVPYGNGSSWEQFQKEKTYRLWQEYQQYLENKEKEKKQQPYIEERMGRGPGPILEAAQGGRIAFGLGGFNKARRAFLKVLGAGAATAGAAKSGLFSLLKAGKPAAQVLTSVPIKDISGMPAWFKPLVNKVIKEGEDVTKKFSTADREIVHTTKLPNSQTDVIVTQDLSTGNVSVDIGMGKHGFKEGHLGQPVRLEYKAAEDIMSGPDMDDMHKVGVRDPHIKVKRRDEMTFDQKKHPDKAPEEFWVEEAEFTGGHPENIKFEETISEKFGSHGSNFDEVEKFATGKIKKKTGKAGIKAEREHWVPEGDMASGGRVPLGGGKLVFEGVVKGGNWLIKNLMGVREAIRINKNYSPERIKLWVGQIDDQIKSLKAGEKIPDEVIQKIRSDPKFKSVWQNQKSADPELREMEEVLLEYGQKHASGGLAGMLGE